MLTNDKEASTIVLNSALDIEGGSRRHSSIVTAVLMSEFGIKFFTCQYGGFFKEPMTKQIDCTVAELARQ